MSGSEVADAARTSVACATEGALTTYGRHPSRTTTTSAGLRERADGSVEVRLPPGSAAVAQLLARPVATLRVAPPWCEPVVLHGAARRLPGVDDDGALRFHLQVAAVRVGSPAVLVDQPAYARAVPDPLRHEVPAVLEHLNTGHAGALSACLRASGHEVGFAQAVRLDRLGLTVLAVRRDGVDTVRLRFPAPVGDLRELPPSLARVLRPGCRCCAEQHLSGG